MRVLKSRIAPRAIIEKQNYFLMNDKFVKNLLVLALPPEFNVGLLSQFTRNPNIKVFLKTDILKIDIARALNKEYKEKEGEYVKTRDLEYKKRLENELVSFHEYISDTVANNDKTYNVTMLFQVQEDSLELLNEFTLQVKEDLRQFGFKVEAVSMQQLNLLKFATPLFIDTGIDPLLQYNIGVPLTTKSFAGMYPYTFESLKDEKGFVFAREKNNSGIILWDPLLYQNNPEEAKNQNRLTSNIVILGKTGSGKTTDLSLILRHLIREKTQIIWVDPENKNKYLTNKYGGTYIQWGAKEHQINVFDLLPIAVDEDEEYVDPYDTEMAMMNTIDNFKQLLKLYKPNISDDTIDCISELCLRLYARFGIKEDANGNYKSFQGMSAKEFPTLSDFKYQIEIEREELAKLENINHKKLNALDDLKSKIMPMLIEHKYYFDGHTTISAGLDDRRIISFGTRILFNKSLELRNAMNFLMFSYIKGICLDERNRSAVAFSEAHLYLTEGVAAEECAILYRRSRKYNNLSILDTQEPSDLNNEAIKLHGKAIMNNSTYKIIKHLEKNAIKSLDELITLTDSEKEEIELFTRGDALFIIGDKKLAINVVATEKELHEINPS